MTLFVMASSLRRGKAVASSAQSLSQDDDVCTDLLVDHLHGFQSHKMLQPHEVNSIKHNTHSNLIIIYSPTRA